MTELAVFQSVSVGTSTSLSWGGVEPAWWPCRVFTSPLEGEVDRAAIGRGVGHKLRACGSPPSLTLPLKGGGNGLSLRWGTTDG